MREAPCGCVDDAADLSVRKMHFHTHVTIANCEAFHTVYHRCVAVGLELWLTGADTFHGYFLLYLNIDSGKEVVEGKRERAVRGRDIFHVN